MARSAPGRRRWSRWSARSEANYDLDQPEGRCTLAMGWLTAAWGVDTKEVVHVASALDELGRLLGTYSCPTTAAGYRQHCGAGWAE